MKLVHSISMTLLVSAAASISACSEPAEPSGNGGSGGSAGAGTSGSAGSGGAGAGVGGSAGSAGSGTSGTAGSGTSGSGGSSGSSGGLDDHPTDTSQAGIEAFLAAASYASGVNWRPETMAGSPTSVPHLATRRYFNETLIASKAAGNNPPTGSQHTAGSMAVKEILEGTTVVGKAAMLRTDTGWVFYCTASMDGRCYTGSVANTPLYGTAAGGSCACHTNGAMPSYDAIPAP